MSRGRVICYAPTAARRRHLVPVAAAGGWPLLSVLPADCGDALAVVCCHGSEKKAAAAGAAGTILLEHGLGQNYLDDPALTPWGAGRGFCEKRRALVVPGPYIAVQHAAVSPVPVAAVGSPFLDAWAGRQWIRPGLDPVIAFSTRGDCPRIPATRRSWPWIKEALPGLARRWRMLGHWHPHEAREGGALPERLAFYAEHGIEPVAQFEEVMERADVYICDNSSSLYEFAALGKPVVVVSPPWYRRQVHSGLRFWEALPGVEVRRPEALAETVAAVLADDSDGARLRAKAMPLAWGALDGGAAARAAAVINSFLHSES